LYPYLLTLQIIPRISWILIAMIWFPLNSQIVIFIISITIMPTIAINTLEGLENIDSSLLEMARVYKIKGNQIVRNIYLPSIAPYVFSGMKIALGITWKTVIMAELLTVQTGLGARMSYAKTSFSTDHILALTVYIIIIGLFFQGVLSKVKAHFERWKFNEK
ncbi:MAG: ABC transporter permease subunit, partial [Clostridiales bacterium]|nr:ABC transporter permease subunit [Clostridiales bacterium]